MESEHDTVQAYRSALLGVLVVGLLWQIHVVFLVFRFAGTFQALFHGLGAELPIVTTAFFTVYKFCFIFPVLSAALTVDLFRRLRPTPTRVIVVSVIVYALGFGLLALTFEILYPPMFALMGKVG
jgi:hypothetical protein